MHKSAYIYAEKFFSTYTNKNDLKNIKIVEIGSQNINGSIRDIVSKEADYLGLDFEEGDGVDVIVTDPYSLPIGDEHADIVISSSVFEHSDMFWLLYLDCLRILKPSGLLYLNAPSNGMVHRFPIDSWRFYPDAGKSLISWSNYNGLNTVLLESFIGRQIPDAGLEGSWNDFVAIFLKDKKHSCHYPDRISDKEHDIRSIYSLDREITTKTFENNEDIDQKINMTESSAEKSSIISSCQKTIQDLQLQLIESKKEVEKIKAENRKKEIKIKKLDQGFKQQEKEIEKIKKQSKPLKLETDKTIYSAENRDANKTDAKDDLS